MPHVQVAQQFATALSRAEFEAAHRLLTPAAQAAMPIEALRRDYTEMVRTEASPATQVEVMQQLTRWPEKQPGDVGWVYVAIGGDSFSEAVTVVVCRDGDREAIRSVEWGRP